MDIVALTCDTTGTLIASSYVNPNTKIAVIFGTGCNAAYMETVKNIPKLKDLGFADDAEIAINCEWVRNFSRPEPSTFNIPAPGSFRLVQA